MIDDINEFVLFKFRTAWNATGRTWFPAELITQLRVPTRMTFASSLFGLVLVAVIH